MSIITPGRKPTLGEVLDYYTRDDFLSFLFHVLQTTRVVTVISKKLHWEPDWERDEVEAETIPTLKDFIVDKIKPAYPNTKLDDYPQFYPSFHQSVWRQIVPGHPESNALDCVFEADLPTWRDSFRDVGAAISLMEAHNVRYRHKFSGHRSLHIVLPSEIIPAGYRGKGSSKLAQHISRWSSSSAHFLPKITRMPYSLNEDTGLVCLPIQRGGLPDFRPWMANIHLVKVDADDWFEILKPTDAAQTTAFVQATKDQEAVVNPVYFVSNWDSMAQFGIDNLKLKSKEYQHVKAWSRLADGSHMPLHDLLTKMQADDADIRWLALEAYLFHGAELDESTVYHLLSEGDEYGRVSATDVLLKYEDDIAPYLVKLMGNFDHYSETSAKAALLLTLSVSLRQKVLDELVEDSGKSFDAIIISACVAGTIANDWKSAFRMLEPVYQAENLDPRYLLQSRALEMMQDMGGWNRKEGAEKALRLAALGPDIVMLLLLAAGSPNRKLRRDMTTAMVELADPRTVEHLVRALGDEYSKVRRKAIAALVRIGAPAVDSLMEALDSDQPNIRGFAATCLGHIRDPKAKNALLSILDDENENVRRRVIRSLKHIITEDDLPRMVEIMLEAPPEHAKPIVETLSSLGEAARGAMEDLGLRMQHPNAAYYLAVNGDQRGRDILIKHLHSDDETLVTAAIELLTELRDPNVVPFLADYLQTVTHWRAMWYAVALGEIATTEAVDALIGGLDREYMLARRGAVRGLSLAKDPRSIPHLINALTDEDGKTRSLAGDALINIGAHSIAPLQQALLEDSFEAKRRSNRVKHLLEKLVALYPDN